MRTGTARVIAGLLIVAVFAVVWARLVLGAVPLDIHNLHWVWGDLAQVYVAWSQYLSDPQAHWLTSTRLSYPKPISISLFDPMPLLLLLARPISGWVPSGTQYFGFYFVACLVLQGVFGYMASLRALRLVGAGRDVASMGIAVLAGVLFASIPYTFYRFQGHTALSSQWVLVLAIWVGLSSLDWRLRRWCIANGAVVFLATGLNPYLALLILISDGLLTVTRWRELGTREITTRLGILGVVAALGLWMFGFMAGSTADTGGYGIYSMNLLGPLDSNGVARLLPLDIPDVTGGQSFEGYTYLGLGILLLCPLALVSCLKAPAGQRPVAFPFLPALLIVLACTLLALSSKLTLGNHVLDIPLPKALTYLLSRFRGSGRLFWMAGFWLILVCVVTCVHRLGTKLALSLLVVLVGVQMVDIQAIGSQVSRSISSVEPLQLKGIPEGNYSAILVYPAWQCDNQGTPGGGVRNYESVGYFATSRHIPTNNFYAARTPSDQSAFHCDFAARLQNIDPHAVYLLSATLFDQYRDRFVPTHRCERFEESSWRCLPESAP